jgi:hypothetical protein
MTTNASRQLVRRARIGPSLTVTVAAAVLLSGCGDGSSTAQGPVVTVTTTPTVTASIPQSPASRTTQASATRSDDVGRTFDLGTIVRREDVGGVSVLIFDRWSARGVSDSTLAANGVPIRVHSDAPFENLNTKNTFRIPVVQGAIFTYNHCVAVDQPAQQRSSTLQEFATLQAAENIVLLTLDPKGQVFKAENDPAC